MPVGRPTSDPRQHLVAVRLAERHIRLLRSRARSEGVTLSEALRRLLDACLLPAQTPMPHKPKQEQEAQPPARSLRSRKPNAEERRIFNQVFEAIGMKPVSRRRTRR